jgi:hypothetical protein
MQLSCYPTTLRKYLLSLGPESVLSSAIQEYKVQNLQTIILPIVLDGCGTWSLILRKDVDVPEQGAEDDIWTYGKGNVRNRRMVKIVQ